MPEESPAHLCAAEAGEEFEAVCPTEEGRTWLVGPVERLLGAVDPACLREMTVADAVKLFSSDKDPDGVVGRLLDGVVLMLADGKCAPFMFGVPPKTSGSWCVQKMEGILSANGGKPPSRLINNQEYKSLSSHQMYQMRGNGRSPAAVSKGIDLGRALPSEVLKSPLGQWMLACMGDRAAIRQLVRWLAADAEWLHDLADLLQHDALRRAADDLSASAAHWRRIQDLRVEISASAKVEMPDELAALAADPLWVEGVRRATLSEVVGEADGGLRHLDVEICLLGSALSWCRVVLSDPPLPDDVPGTSTDGTPARDTAPPRVPRTSVAGTIGTVDRTDSIPKTFSLLTTGVRVMGDPVRGDDVWEAMISLFPWCPAANRELAAAAEISARSSGGGVRIPPLLLLGPPGCGKSRWAGEAARVMGLPFQSVSFAGANSSVLVNGTERGWSGARPGMAAMAMRNLDCANPLMLVDEVDKAGARDGRNGNPIDAMLTLLEPETSRRAQDICLLTWVDASRISWVLTANSIDHLPGPMLSRVTLVRLDAPPPEFLPGILDGMRETLRGEWGLAEDAMPELSGRAVEKLLENYRGSGDLRAVMRRVRAHLQAEIWSPPARGALH